MNCHEVIFLKVEFSFLAVERSLLWVGVNDGFVDLTDIKIGDGRSYGGVGSRLVIVS